MSKKPPCPDCDRVHPSNAARAFGIFSLGPVGYQADYPAAPIRPTRAQAERDMCIRWRKDVQ